jgi:hypothetical protein
MNVILEAIFRLDCPGVCLIGPPLEIYNIPLNYPCMKCGFPALARCLGCGLNRCMDCLFYDIRRDMHDNSNTYAHSCPCQCNCGVQPAYIDLEELMMQGENVDHINFDLS